MLNYIFLCQQGYSSQFYFPVGKIFFLSWKIIFFQLGTFRTPFWRIFVRFWPIMVIISKYQKSFTFLSLFRHKNKRNIFITLTQISPIPQMLLLFREIRERNNAYTPTKLIANHKTRNKSVKKREKGVCTECGKILKYISN